MTVLAYRRIAVAGRLMVVLWVGMLITVGLGHRHGPDPFRRGPGLRLSRSGLATRAVSHRPGWGWHWRSRCMTSWAITRSAIWATKSPTPPRTIPRSILISVVVVGLVYLTMNIGILGVIPWREVVDSKHVASDLMLRVHGPWAAGLATVMIIWTALASTYAALLGYSRIPYASARAGHFFKTFAATHPTGHFPPSLAAA